MNTTDLFNPDSYLDFMGQSRNIVSQVMSSTDKYIPIFILFIVGIILMFKGTFYAKLIGLMLIGLGTTLCMLVVRGKL